uniref:Protein phosphatase 2A beta subunit mRNA n=1 Tax=Homo sapiens TaxID=9606 RepID=A2NAY4_HUMAN|nr:upstream ORF 2 [Homo sapiens]
MDTCLPASGSHASKPAVNGGGH